QARGVYALRLVLTEPNPKLPVTLPSLFHESKSNLDKRVSTIQSSADRFGPQHIREYQAELFQKRKLSPALLRTTWRPCVLFTPQKRSHVSFPSISSSSLLTKYL